MLIITYVYKKSRKFDCNRKFTQNLFIIVMFVKITKINLQFILKPNIQLLQLRKTKIENSLRMFLIFRMLSVYIVI